MKEIGPIIKQGKVEELSLVNRGKVMLGLLQFRLNALGITGGAQRKMVAEGAFVKAIQVPVSKHKILRIEYNPPGEDGPYQPIFVCAVGGFTNPYDLSTKAVIRANNKKFRCTSQIADAASGITKGASSLVYYYYGGPWYWHSSDWKFVSSSNGQGGYQNSFYCKNPPVQAALNGMSSEADGLYIYDVAYKKGWVVYSLLLRQSPNVRRYVYAIDPDGDWHTLWEKRNVTSTHAPFVDARNPINRDVTEVAFCHINTRKKGISHAAVYEVTIYRIKLKFDEAANAEKDWDNVWSVTETVEVPKRPYILPRAYGAVYEEVTGGQVRITAWKEKFVWNEVLEHYYAQWSGALWPEGDSCLGYFADYPDVDLSAYNGLYELPGGVVDAVWEDFFVNGVLSSSCWLESGEESQLDYKCYAYAPAAFEPPADPSPYEPPATEIIDQTTSFGVSPYFGLLISWEDHTRSIESSSVAAGSFAKEKVNSFYCSGNPSVNAACTFQIGGGYTKAVGLSEWTTPLEITWGYPVTFEGRILVGAEYLSNGTLVPIEIEVSGDGFVSYYGTMFGVPYNEIVASGDFDNFITDETTTARVEAAGRATKNFINSGGGKEEYYLSVNQTLNLVWRHGNEVEYGWEGCSGGYEYKIVLDSVCVFYNREADVGIYETVEASEVYTVGENGASDAHIATRTYKARNVSIVVKRKGKVVYKVPLPAFEEATSTAVINEMPDLFWWSFLPKENNGHQSFEVDWPLETWDTAPSMKARNATIVSSKEGHVLISVREYEPFHWDSVVLGFLPEELATTKLDINILIHGKTGKVWTTNKLFKQANTVFSPGMLLERVDAAAFGWPLSRYNR